MSGTLTITVGNLTLATTNVDLSFVGSGTCLVTISNNPGDSGTFTLNGVISCPIPASGSNQTIIISNVTVGATSFSIATNQDNVISVATTNSATWGLSATSTPTLTSLANAFLGADSLVSVPDDIPSTVTNLSGTFNGCSVFNGIANNNGTTNGTITNWGVRDVTDMSNMFRNCAAFNNNGVALWNNNSGLRSTSSVTTMLNMFNGCTIFNADISNWNTSNVNNMSTMFRNANAFNIDISGWDTSSVTNMSNMFSNTASSSTIPVFNKNIRYWTIRNSTDLTTMFSNPSPFATLYYNTVDPAGWGPLSGATPDATRTPLFDFFNEPLPVRNPCFMKGTQILCFRGEEEVYRPVQDLRKGDLVKTYRNGYLPVHMIGTSSLSNPGHEARIPNRLYKCSKELYPDLFEDLYITGCHSILVPALTNDQWENTKEMLGNVYITDNHFRLMACVDEKSQPYKRDAMIDIYHIALENDDYYMNYGVYANGLLVETCSKRYLTELSNMRIIGEDEACYDTPKVNVFSELGAFVQSC